MDSTITFNNDGIAVLRQDNAAPCVGSYVHAPSLREKMEERAATRLRGGNGTGATPPGGSVTVRGGTASTKVKADAVAAAHRCPCCESPQIAYNTAADVWHCSNCSWSKRQLVEAPPGPKFAIGAWVVLQHHTVASQVVDVKRGHKEWVYTVRNEFVREKKDDQAVVDTRSIEELLRAAGPNDPRSV